MKVCTCFLLFRIFAYTNSSPLHETKEDKNGVDLDLDGSLKLYVDKNAKNISEKRTIGAYKISRRDNGSPSVETFTDFVQEVIKIVDTYDDNTFKDFIQILDKEIKKYHYKGYKYHKLMENDEFRNFVDEKFDSINGKSVSFIKNKMNEVAENIKHKTYDKNVKKMLNFINSIYKEDDREKFQKVLTDLKVFSKANHGKSKNELVKVTRYGIWAIIFKHYTNLNDKQKEGLLKEIEEYLKRVTETPSPRFKTNVIRHKPEISDIKTIILNLKNVTTKVFKPITLKRIDPKSTTVQITAKNNRRRNLRTNTNEKLSENEKTTLETSQDESDSQQLILTYKSTSGETTEGSSREMTTDTSSDETGQGSYSDLSQAQHRKLNAQPYDTLYIEDFYKTTEKPATYKPEMDSKLVEGMSIEEASDRLPASQPNTKARHRYRTSPYPAPKKRIVSRNAKRSRTISKHLRANDQNNFEYNLKHRDLRRSIAPPMPEEELSIEVFEREKIKRERSLAKSYSFVKNNSIQHGLKDYVKRRRNLVKKINELKKMYENIQHSKVNVTTYKGDDIKINKDDFEIKDKNSQQQIEDGKDETAVSETQSYTHNARAQTEKTEIKDGDTQEAVKKPNLINKDLEDNDKEKVETDDKHTLKKKKPKTVKINETTKPNTQNTDTEYKYPTNSMTTTLYNLKSVKIPVFIELLATAKKKKEVTEITKVTKKIDNEI